MEDVKSQLAGKILDLNDLELAALTCLIASEHCIVYAPSEGLGHVADELQEIASDTFGLSCTVFDCNETTTVNDFGVGILVDDEEAGDDGGFTGLSRYSWDRDVHQKQDHGFRSHHQQTYGDHSEQQKIADVVVAKNLHVTQHHVQIQTLELIRSKRIFTRTAVHTAPKRFLFIALLPVEDGLRLIPQLNDHIFISHNHLSNLDEDDEDEPRQAPSISDNASESSVIHSPPITPGIGSPSHRSSLRCANPTNGPIITPSNITSLITATSSVRLDSEVRSYLHNISIFLRMHRAVAGGISALATRHLLSLSHALAPLHGQAYVSPSLVALAARKVYPHRIVLATAENEKSLMWGSDVAAVKELLEGITVEDVLEDVLDSVETPL